MDGLYHGKGLDATKISRMRVALSGRANEIIMPITDMTDGIIGWEVVPLAQYVRQRYIVNGYGIPRMANVR